MLKIREKTASRCRCCCCCATACSRTEHRCKQALIAACCVVLCYDVLSCVVMCGREAVHLAPHLNEADFDALLAAAVQVPSGDAHRHKNSHFSHVFPSDMQMQQGLKKKPQKPHLYSSARNSSSRLSSSNRPEKKQTREAFRERRGKREARLGSSDASHSSSSPTLAAPW